MVSNTVDLSYTSFDANTIDFVTQGLNNLLCQYNKSYDQLNAYEKNNIRKYLKIVLSEMQDVVQIASDFDGILDIDNVSGSALDYIGSLVGIDRLQCAAICKDVFTSCSTGLGSTGNNPPIVPETNLQFVVLEEQEVSSIITSDPFIDTTGSSLNLTLSTNNLPDTISFFDNSDGTFTLIGNFPDVGNYNFIVSAKTTFDSSESFQYFTVIVNPIAVTDCPQFTTDQLDMVQIQGNIVTNPTLRMTLRIGDLFKIDGSTFNGYKITNNTTTGTFTPSTIESQSNTSSIEYYTESAESDRWCAEQLTGDTLDFGTYNQGDFVANEISGSLVISNSEFPVSFGDIATITKTATVLIKFFCNDTGNIIQKILTMTANGYKVSSIPPDIPTVPIDILPNDQEADVV